MASKCLAMGAGLVAAFVGVPVAVAQVTLVSQARAIEYRIRWENEPPLSPGFSSGFNVTSWNDFGPFEVYSRPQLPQAPEDPYVAAYQRLRSALSINRISGDGDAVATLTVPADHIAARAKSRASVGVGFEVSGPIRFHMDATAALTVGDAAYSHSFAEVRLSGPGKPVVDERIEGGDALGIVVDSRGFLAPGQYEVVAWIEANIENTSAALNAEDAATFDLDLRLGHPADFNFDGGVTSQDFFEYLAAFFVGNPSAEYTGDNSVDSADFFEFLEWFVGG